MGREADDISLSYTAPPLETRYATQGIREGCIARGPPLEKSIGSFVIPNEAESQGYIQRKDYPEAKLRNRFVKLLSIRPNAKMPRQPAVYILANVYRTLYIGVTGDLEQRRGYHLYGKEKSWAKRYSLNRLVYFELYPDMASAITRETQLKKWNRAKKLRLIESMNADWTDLWANWEKGSIPIPRQARNDGAEPVLS